MCIRRGGLQAIYQAFIDGEQYEQAVPGDQDFIRGVVQRHGLLAQVGTFPEHQVVSFKLTARAGRRNAEWARQRVREATIVKFHGHPKMHEAFGWRYWMHLRTRELLHGHLRPVMPMRALRREWMRGAAG
jgi:hypothetical protein